MVVICNFIKVITRPDGEGIETEGKVIGLFMGP
jgi:hypothetical protein